MAVSPPVPVREFRIDAGHSDVAFSIGFLGHPVRGRFDDIRGTIIRQTMFAELEKITHEMSEAGQPLTVKAFRDAYRKLLADYSGPAFEIDA